MFRCAVDLINGARYIAFGSVGGRAIWLMVVGGGIWAVRTIPVELEIWYSRMLLRGWNPSLVLEGCLVGLSVRTLFGCFVLSCLCYLAACLMASYAWRSLELDHLGKLMLLMLWRQRLKAIEPNKSLIG